MSFRQDIEGLRAVAVLGVIACHAWPAILPGGLAGVDIFFVISGFLIGGHLLESIRANRFSPAAFYVRRARRLFPALATVLLGVWVAAGFIFTPAEFAELGRHMAASVIFANNIWIWWTSDLAGNGLLSQPLLHLWSLGVEEQFYLLAPAILWLGLRGEGRPMAWVTRLGVLSVAALLAVILLAPAHRLAAFYLLPTRFWELAVGIALAWWQLEGHRSAGAAGPAVRVERVILAAFVLLLAATSIASPLSGGAPDRFFAATGLVAMGIAAFAACKGVPQDALHGFVIRHASALSVAGLVLLAAPMPFLTWAAWPGPQVTVPVLGAALLVAAPPAALANRALAWRPLAWLGSISYPLYLWHWPVLVIHGFLYPDSSATDQWAPVLLAVLLAWLTKTWIEDPVRFGFVRGRPVRRPGIPAVSAALAGAGIAGIVTFASGGLPARLPAASRAVALSATPPPFVSWRLNTCFLPGSAQQDFAPECTPQRRAGVQQVLLWGDAQAAQFYPGLSGSVGAGTFDLLQWTVSDCPPSATKLRGEAAGCDARRQRSLDAVRAHPPDTAFIAAAWRGYEDGDAAALGASVAATVRTLRSAGVRQVIVAGPGPVWHKNWPEDLAHHIASHRNDTLPPRFDRLREPGSLKQLDAALRVQAEANGATYFSALSLLCNDQGCLTGAGQEPGANEPIYWGVDHLSPAGSRFVIAQVRHSVAIPSQP